MPSSTPAKLAFCAIWLPHLRAARRDSSSRTEEALVVAQKVVEGNPSLLRDQNPLAYLCVDDELLLAVAEVERNQDEQSSSVVLSGDAWNLFPWS